MAVVVVILLLLVVRLRESLEVTSLVVKLQALLRTLKQVKFHSLFEGRGYSWSIS